LGDFNIYLEKKYLLNHIVMFMPFKPK